MNEESQKTENKSDEEIVINSDILNNIGAFIYKHRAYFLVLIPIILTFYIRLLPIEQPITEDWARNTVYNYYRGQIDAGISKQFPNLPSEQRAKIIEQEIAKVYSTQGQTIEQQVQQVRNQIRQSYTYEVNGKLYPLLGDLDSYFWLRFARNLDEKGMICDEKIDNVCYDSYTVAPVRSSLDIPFLHSFSIFYLYKIFRIFDSSITLMQSSFLTPLVFALFSVIFIFIMVKRMVGTLSALISTILVAVNPIFLSRSFGSDTDVYNPFFAGVILYLTYESFRAKNLKKIFLFSLLSGIVTVIYSYAWSGWWYTFLFTIFALAGNVCVIIFRNVINDKKLDFNKLKSNELIKKSIFIMFVLLIVVGILISLIAGFNSYLSIFTTLLSGINFKTSAGSALWPNVLTTVAEFGGSSASAGISQVGGNLIFALAMLGIILLSYNKLGDIVKALPWILISLLIILFSVSNQALSMSASTYVMILSLPLLMIILITIWKKQEIDFRMPFLLFIMIVSATYSVTWGNRFALLLVVPVSISAGISVEFLYRFVIGLISQFTNKKHLLRIVIKLALFILLLFLVVKKPIDAGVSVGRSYMPTINKQWVDSLTYIKDNSKPDAIINSWWDFGHWFKYFADRRVTLDGSSQNNPQLHWLGKLILTSDENTSIGILRMLDCGANTAFDVINSKINFSPKSINILNKIIPIQDRDIAKSILEDNGFNGEESENILKYTHCSPPEDFYITSGDMVYKSGVWSHFGSWDFDKAYMQSLIRSNKPRQEVIDNITKNLNISVESANAIYDEVNALPDDSSVNTWIASWSGYNSGIGGCQRVDNETIACPLPQQGSVLVNITSMDAYLNTPQGVMHPNSIVYNTNDTVKVKDYENNTFGISLILISEGDSYSSIYASPSVAPSIFTRLFYLEGKGLKYFHKAFDIRDAGGSRIIVWKISWP